MRNKLIIYIISIAGLLSVQASCRNTNVGGTADCPKQDIDVLNNKLRKQAIDYTFFYAKVKVNIKDSESSNSFNATLKMKPDSAFAGTVKVAGILGAAYLIDQDTFAYKNKINKCYKKQSYAVLSETFGTEVSYNFMQQLVLGQAVGVEKLEALFPLKDDNYYVLASHDKKAFQRLETLNLNDEEQGDIFVKYTLDCSELQLVRIDINVPKDAVVISIEFTKRQTIEGISFPEETDIKIVSPKDSVFIDLDYTNTSINDSRKINLSIPDSYNECE